MHGTCFCGFVDGSPHPFWGSHFQQLSVGDASPLGFIMGFQKLVLWLSPPFTFCLYSGCFDTSEPFPPAKACLPAQSPHVSESGTHLYSLSNSRECRPQSSNRQPLVEPSLDKARPCLTLATSSSPPCLQAGDKEGAAWRTLQLTLESEDLSILLLSSEDPRLY